jgi:hypothetical protein
MLRDVHVVGVSPLRIARLFLKRAGNFINAEAVESAEDAVGGVCICEHVYVHRSGLHWVVTSLTSGASFR